MKGERSGAGGCGAWSKRQKSSWDLGLGCQDIGRWTGAGQGVGADVCFRVQWDTRIRDEQTREEHGKGQSRS